MQIRVKTKLSMGLAFLFAVIILIGSMGAIYIHKIANMSKEIIKANYESIECSKSMMQAIDDLKTDSIISLAKFETNLKAQENNITEIGEAKLTQEVRNEFESFKKNIAPNNAIQHIRQLLYQITDVNMRAIVRKNNLAQATADRVLSYIGIIGGLCFIIVFTFIINFPGYIADPIKEFTESIKQIAAKNYDQRLNFKSHDEFGELAEAFNAMAEKLDHYENSNLAKLLFEKKRIETIINNMRDAIIGLNEKKIILFANLKAIQLLGLNETDLIGKYAPDVALRNDLMRLLISTETNTQPIKIFADSKESYFTKENIAITSDDKPIGEVILLKNITRFQELDLAKTNLIATISHELKTPVASILLSVKLIDNEQIGNLNTEQKGLLKNIKEEAGRLLKITGEVLNMGQVEEGKIQLNIKETSPTQITEYAIEAIKTQATAKKISLKLHIESNLPNVFADAEKTVWVLVNILNNALRYSPEGSPLLIQVTKENSFIKFSVKDSGPGIDSVYKEKVFDKYFQIPESNKKGSGLGLAIAKEFIEIQHGKIWVESKLGEGCNFCFTLPIY